MSATCEILEITSYDAEVATLPQPDLYVIETLQRGEKGADGQPGPTAAFIHQQTSAATEWIVNHNLGVKPIVEVRNSGGAVGIAEIIHQSANQLRIYFASPTAGEARCI